MTLASTMAPGAPDTGRDPLTGALGRGFFVALLEREVVQADETGQAFALCLLDVDELAKINLEAGFRAGDRVLGAVADIVRQRLRAEEGRGVPAVTSRYDGDGLALLLRSTHREAVASLAEDVAGTLASVELAGSVRASVSAAVVLYEFGESVDALLGRLERTLHVAKQFGPGCVEVAPSGGWERAARLNAAVG
jgi:diguanylate cyclase (GGDEF)-like protein